MQAMVLACYKVIPMGLRRRLRMLLLGAPSTPIALTDIGIELRRHVEEYFDAAWYAETYPDVVAAGQDPLTHFLRYGIDEARKPWPGAQLRFGANAAKLPSRGWVVVGQSGRTIALQRYQVPPLCIQNELVYQAQFDSSVLAGGISSMPNLRVFRSDDLMHRDGVDAPAIIHHFSNCPDVVVVLSMIGIGGAEKYAADIIESLERCGRKVAVIVTEQSREQAGDWQLLDVTKPLWNKNILFWPNVSEGRTHGAVFLSRLLNAVKPRHVIIVNSRIALAAVCLSGKGLSRKTRFYTCFFSFAPIGGPGTLGDVYLNQTLQYAAVLTDNTRAATHAQELGGQLGPSVHVLPPRVALVSDGVFDDRASRRAARFSQVNRKPRWVWISRIEPLKGTLTLSQIAAARPNDCFDVFGPIQDPTGLNLDAPNVNYRGILQSPLEADLTEYDGFLFTSVFEGMPNVVLEMTQQAIPLVLTDVGGLRDTFSDQEAAFVDIALGGEPVLSSFKAALDATFVLTSAQLMEQVSRARSAVARQHSPKAHLRRVAEIFN